MLFKEFRTHCKAIHLDAREIHPAVWVITHAGDDIVTVWPGSRCYEITSAGRGSTPGGPHQAIYDARQVVNDQPADEPVDPTTVREAALIEAVEEFIRVENARLVAACAVGCDTKEAASSLMNLSDALERLGA